MPAARRVSAVLVVIAVLPGASEVQAHHLGHPHPVAGVHVSGAATFDVCVRPSPSKSFYWQSFEKREETSCPQWRRVMAEAVRRAHAGSHH